MKNCRELRRLRAFTLIEIMMVVAVLGLVLAMGMPAIYTGAKKAGMRRAVSDIEEACRRARAQAIMSGTEAVLVFHPLDKRMDVGGSSAPSSGDSPDSPAPAPAGAGFSAQLPDNVNFEMLDVNLTEYREAEEARVRFYPNGMCDEMTIVLHSDDGGWQKITLEITTGRSSVGDVR